MNKPNTHSATLHLIPVGELLDELGRRLGCEALHLEGYYPRWAEDVINVSAEVYNVKPQDLLIDGRNSSIVHARMSACAILRHRNKEKSLQEIGNLFSKGHDMVIHSVKRVEQLANTDADFRANFTAICKMLAFSSTLKS